MKKPRLGIAAGNKLGADAAVEVASAGGNAVDACLAAAIMGWVAEPFFASIGGSGFITVRAPDGAVKVYDGNNSMPYTAPGHPGQGMKRVYLEYSNGMYTGIGGGSIAVPGILAAAHEAWERHGAIEWAALFEPSIRAARNGIPFPRSSDYYLSETWDQIWGRFPEAQTLFGVDEPMRQGETLLQGDLADALEQVAQKGPDTFYRGELATEITDAIAADDGFMTVDDLDRYRAEIRAPIVTEVFGWRIESNPPPAVGGVVLTHMLSLLQTAKLDEPLDRLRSIVEAERAAIGYHADHYQEPGEIAGSHEEALSRARRRTRSPDTTHASAADADGYVCAITQSNGYGAGLVIHGMLFNNTLGEEELNPLGVHRLPPGSRCHSNQAPTVACGPDSSIVVGLGSPGAERIVGAIAQTFIGIAVDRRSLVDAVSAPRGHLAQKPDGPLMCFEPGLPGEELGYTPRPYDDLHMFFGAVQAASVTADGDVDAACDPRRSTAAALV
ncbi:MAG: gamma-glutamyltransferase family protein [Actinomycetota bacterium]|nr:gamma-glutamyltransferase family protein [Actinomycetota bacterium]